MFASKDIFLTPPSGGYTIARSVRLRSSASAYFNRTFTTPTNNTTWTWSAWIKRGALDNVMLWAGASGNLSGIGITSNQIIFYGSAGSGVATSTAVFRDPSAWYHMVFVSNGTTIVAYVNNVQVLSYTGTLTQLNASGGQLLFCYRASSSFFDGYATEINFIDGQALTPSSFGSTNAITGVWQPAKYTGTYGTNGFYLNFSDNSNNTAATIGKDYSGNGNNWTPNNISVTAGVTYDSMVDSPTVGATSSNYAVMNPLDMGASVVPAYANLRVGTASAIWRTIRSTMQIPTTGKWYSELTVETSSRAITFGISTASQDLANYTGSGSAGWSYYSSSGEKINAGTAVTYGSAWDTAGTVIGLAFDADAGTLVFYKNNTSQGTAYSGLTAGNYFISASPNNCNVDINFGQRPFSYTPPTGYVALNTYNLPASTITNGAAYMAATTYTGNGSTQSISNAVNGVSFQPDFVWIKDRNTARGSMLFDSVRGIYIRLRSNTTDAEQTETDTLTAFNSNGFNLSTNVAVNGSTETYVGWQWKAGGTSASNTNGTITSTVSAGATQGFSVVTYTGTGVTATVGHGLGVAPQMVIVKNRAAAESWRVGHSFMNSGSSPWNYYMNLNGTGAQAASSSVWNNTAPTSTVFSISNDSAVSGNGQSHVAYCFSAVAGYSAFGYYTGNGSADGPFVYTGFRPRFILIRSTSNLREWFLVDTSRNSFNVANSPLRANTSAAEGSDTITDIVSNGFKLRSSDTAFNGSGETYIYATFAENPFKNALAR